MTGALLLAALGAAVPNGSFATPDGSAIVRVMPCGASVCGRVERVLAQGASIPSSDVHNPDPRFRGRPLVGLPILGGFSWSGSAWTGGWIYDPKSGKTYGSRLSVNPDGSLSVAGCILFICERQRWTPAR